MRTRSSRRSPVHLSGRDGLARRACDSGAERRSPAKRSAGVAAAACSAKPCTSSLVTRPPLPVGVDLAQSTPLSWAMRWASGVARTSPAGTGETASGSTTAAGADRARWGRFGQLRRKVRRGGADGAASAGWLPLPAASRIASTSPTATLSPTRWRISSRMPPCGALTSRVTLSVSNSTSASPDATGSPGLFHPLNDGGFDRSIRPFRGL